MALLVCIYLYVLVRTARICKVICFRKKLLLNRIIIINIACRLIDPLYCHIFFSFVLIFSSFSWCSVCLSVKFQYFFFFYFNFGRGCQFNFDDTIFVVFISFILFSFRSQSIFLYLSFFLCQSTFFLIIFCWFLTENKSSECVGIFWRPLSFRPFSNNMSSIVSVWYNLTSES